MRGICYLIAVIISLSFQSDGPAEANREAAEHRTQSIHLNELATHINSEADSIKLVDEVAEIFKNSLPPAWSTQSVRTRLAHAEYKSATDNASLIPEERLAQVWNHYVREIGAPEEAVVSVAEIHSLRDADYVVIRSFWGRDIKNVWTMPNLVATGADGKVANGCRALEAVRMMYLMSSVFDNVRSARKLVKAGIVASDQVANQKDLEKKPSRYSLEVTRDTNPIRPAEENYIRDHGFQAFNQLLATLFSELFPDESRP